MFYQFFFLLSETEQNKRPSDSSSSGSSIKYHAGQNIYKFVDFNNHIHLIYATHYNYKYKINIKYKKKIV